MEMEASGSHPKAAPIAIDKYKRCGGEDVGMMVNTIDYHDARHFEVLKVADGGRN